jgi:hypothetical protein
MKRQIFEKTDHVAISHEFFPFCNNNKYAEVGGPLKSSANR